MKKLHKLVFVHYNIWLRARNLTCQCNTNDYYNPIDLNNIFNDDILDGWIREGEPILPPGDLGWLDEGIRRNDESGSDGDDDGDGGDDDGGYRGDGSNDEETHGVGGSQRGGAMTGDSEYYTTQDTDHGGRAGISQQHRHLNRLVDLNSSDDYSSGHDNYSHSYHSLEGHLQGLGFDIWLTF